MTPYQQFLASKREALRTVAGWGSWTGRGYYGDGVPTVLCRVSVSPKG